MSYSTVNIKSDANGKPIPQYYSSDNDQYEVLEGEGGANKVIMASVTAAKLQKDAQSRTSITCVDADTDYGAGAVIPAGTKYIVVWAEASFVVAVDEATTASVGVGVPANAPQTFPVVFGAGDSKVHVQSPSAGTVVNVAYLED